MYTCFLSAFFATATTSCLFQDLDESAIIVDNLNLKEAHQSALLANIGINDGSTGSFTTDLFSMSLGWLTD